jgi:hypothetical protein
MKRIYNINEIVIAPSQGVGVEMLINNYFTIILKFQNKKTSCDGLAWLLPGAFCEYRFYFVA